MIKKILLILIIPIFNFSQIISYDLISSWDILDVQEVYNLNFIPSYAGEINYNVEGYKVNYYTQDANGNPIIASGAIFLPINSCSAPILSWQHGTIVADSGAPSQNINNNTIGIIAASHGYIVLMSDYLGLGEGEGFHNYCHAETEALAVKDLIISSLDFFEAQNITTNNQLFLMGYSQGGHATMASVKKIEENEVLNITASCPMAGPYSMSDAQAEMLNVVYPNPGYFPYVIFAYQNVYGNIYSELSDIFKPGFENLIDFYDGNFSMTEINQEIWSIAENQYNISIEDFKPIDMIQDEYYLQYLNNENHPFTLALTDNDLINFIPQSPMQLIHCNGDDNVPYENAIMAFEAFFPFANKELILLDGGNFNHSECAQFSIISAKLFFDDLANFCNESYLDESLKNKSIVKTINILGQTMKTNKHSINIILYSDGSIEKIIKF